MPANYRPSVKYTSYGNIALHPVAEAVIGFRDGGKKKSLNAFNYKTL
jgi:hypothetical protein